MLATVEVLFAGEKTNSSPTLRRAALDSSRDDAPFIETVDVLHAKPQRLILGHGHRLQLIERLEQGRTGIPFQRIAARSGDVRSGARRGRDKATRLQPERLQKIAILALDLAKSGTASNPPDPSCSRPR